MFWQKNDISGESGRKLVILRNSDRKLFSCNILAELLVILQDPDKNGYLGELWQKEWPSCNNLAINVYLAGPWQNWLIWKILAERMLILQ